MLNKKMIEGAIVLGIAGMLSITAFTNGDITDVVMADTSEQNIAVEHGSLEYDEITAGVTAALQDFTTQVTIEKEDAGVVATSNDESSLSKEEKEWQDNLMADVDEFVYVRKKASKKSDIVGKLYKGNLATIIKSGKHWTKIESGNVKGYIKNEFCVMGTDALEYAEENCQKIAKVKTDGLRIRTKQSTKKGKVVTSVASGTKLKVNTDKKTKDGWVAVEYEGKTCYVSEEYVKVKFSTGKAITIKEEQEAIKAAKEAAEAEAKAKAEEEALKNSQQAQETNSSSNQSSSNNSSSNSSSKSTNNSSSNKSSSNQSGPSTKQGSSVAANADDTTLLAALIQCEAGGCSYQTQLGIGSVVCNRIKSGSFPGSLRGVIYQRGQFGPASSGKLERVLSSGNISSTSRKAAVAALSGTDNTKGAKYFKLASSGHSGVVIGPVVFY